VPSGGKMEPALLENYADFIADHLPEVIPLLDRWIEDVNGSGEGAAGKLKGYLGDPEPMIRKAAAYTLGQMHDRSAIHEISTLLNDPSLWVRDAAVLALARFGNEVISPLGASMAGGTASFKILSMDVLVRIGGDEAGALIEKYAEDPNENVSRAARQALAGPGQRTSEVH